MTCISGALPAVWWIAAWNQSFACFIRSWVPVGSTPSGTGSSTPTAASSSACAWSSSLMQRSVTRAAASSQE